MPRLSDRELEAFLAMARDRDRIADAEVSPLFGLLQLMDAALTELQERREQDHDTAFDGTDAAHPSWWRGNDAGVAATCRILARALEADPADEDPHFGSDALTDVFKRVHALASGKLVIGQKVISEPGSRITLTEYELSPTAKKGLRTK